MKIRVQILAVILFTCFSINELYSQSNPLEPVVKKKPILIGPSGGYNRASHPVSIPSISNDNLCPYFENGAQNGFFIGGTFEYLLGNQVNSNSSIITRILYNTMPSSMTLIADKFPSRVLLNNEPTDVETAIEHSLAVDYSLLSLDVQFKQNLFNTTFGIIAGITTDFALTKTWEQLYKLTDFDPTIPIQFEPGPGKTIIDNGRTQVLASGDIPNSASIRVGLKFGLQYEILVGKQYVVPHVNYNLGVTNLSTERDWKVNSIQVGVDVRFAL